MTTCSLLVYSNISCIFCFPGGPRVLTKISSGDIKAKEGDLVNLLCSAQGEPPITFSWKKDQKSLDSIVEIEKPHRSSLLVVTCSERPNKFWGIYLSYPRSISKHYSYNFDPKRYR